MKKQYYFLFAFLFFFVAHAQIINIPDAKFKAILLEANPNYSIASTQTPDDKGRVNNYNTIDTNGDGEIQVSEASLIKYLRLEYSDITTLEGINNFINIESLEFIEIKLKSLDVSGLTNLKRLSCQYCQLTTLNASGLTNLKILFCQYCQLTTLNASGLTNLQNLDCSFNQLTSLDFTKSTNLKFLACNDNKLTSLDASGLANLNTLICYKNLLTSLYVSGLTNLQELNCNNNQLTSLDITGLINLQNFYCGINQLTSLNISGFTNLIKLNCFDNQLTSLDITGLINLQSFYCGINQLTNLDISGLKKLQTLFCDENQLTSLDVSGLTNLQYLSCSDNQLSSLFIKNRNPKWYNLNFERNPNLTYICADDEALSLVQSRINEYGYSATCQVNSYCSFNPGGVFYTLNGINKLDANSNGCDASDALCKNLKYTLTNGSISGNFISNASGNYEIPVTAGTHTITPQFENPSYFTVSPANATVTFPTTASPFVQDFCITPNGVYHDLEVVIIPLVPAVPGFDATYKIKYINKGSVTETASLVLDFEDEFSDFISSTLAPTSQATGKLYWEIGTLAPFESGEIIITLNINSPMETPAVNGGHILNYITALTGLNSDETPLDNSRPLRQIVVNSFDPNDKTCLEGNTIDPRMIGEYVHYKIRFENTGTYAAQNIVVKDIIDTTKFDLSTLQMTDASHSCITRISNPDKVEFIFENINLPFEDATNNGYVVFKIKTKPTLSIGDNISNFANIYFDYNFPIVTNTATSTFQTLANKKFDLDNFVTLSPNPAKDFLNITVQEVENVKSISIYNMLGQLVQVTTSPNKTIDVSALKTGNYIIQFNTEKGEISKKFVKE